MLSINVTTVAELSPLVAQQCELLCHEGSEMRDLFRRVRCESLQPQERGWRIAYARTSHDGVVMVIGWASLTDWYVGGERIPQAQGFVAPAHRNRGIATALCVCLTHGLTKDEMPAAVFSEEFGAIARRLRWQCTQYKSVDDGWIATASFAAAEGGDSAGGDEQR